LEESIAELTRQRVSEALFLIGFGVVWALDWLWPGILAAFGVSWTTSLIIRRKYWAATVVAILLCVVPIAYTIFETWETTVPYLVAGVGVAGLARAIILRR
jgi:hypothetical protein